MNDILSKRVLLVTGKGGVGRTTVSAAMALAAAKSGKRVLITEIGVPGAEYSPLAKLFGRNELPPAVEELRHGVRGALLYSRLGHEQFLKSVLPVSTLVKAAMGSKALSRLLDAVPSFNEMGVFHYLLSLIKEARPDGSPEHEVIIVDMPATGHTLALTGLPDVLLRLMPSGPIADSIREGQEYLYNPNITAACVVTLPETLPVTEAIELTEGLRQTQVPVGAILVNKWNEDDFSPAERAALSPFLARRDFYGALRFESVARAKSEVERLAVGTKARIVCVPEVVGQGDALLLGIASSFPQRRAA